MSALVRPAREDADAYRQACAALHVRPNSALERSAFVAGGAVKVLDLSDNLLGPRGLAALQSLLPHFATSLHTLILTHNELDNTAVVRLADQLASGFAALRVVNLSGNPFTFQAAKHLALMCEGRSPRGASTVRASPPASPSRVSARPGTGNVGATLTAEQLLAHRLSTVGADNNIEQVVLQAMPLLTPVLCECVLKRIDAAIQRRQERKRALRAFQRDTRRRSTIAAGAAAAGLMPETSPTCGAGVEEEFPEDVARTPSGRGTGTAGEPGPSQPDLSPVAFLEQEAAGQLQVDIGMPKAPHIPDILLQRKPTTPSKRGGDSPRLTRVPSHAVAADGDKDGGRINGSVTTAALENSAGLGASVRSSVVSPQRPPLPRPSPRSGASSQAQLSFLLGSDDTKEADDVDDARKVEVTGSGDKDSRATQEGGSTEDGGGFQEEAVVDDEDDDNEDNEERAMYHDGVYSPEVDDAHYGVAATDDWLFTGALEPLDFTPPGSAQAGLSTVPPSSQMASEIPPFDLEAMYPLEAPAFAPTTPAPTGTSGDAMPGFLDDLLFDIGAMDVPVEESSPIFDAPQAATPPSSQPTPAAADDDGAPSWLDF